MGLARAAKTVFRPNRKPSEFRECGPGVYRLNLPWVNVWLTACDGRGVLIDTGVHWDRDRIDTALDLLGVKLEGIILTHAHPDHAGNAAHLSRKHSAWIACHADEAPFLATRRTYIPQGMRRFGPSGGLFALGEAIWPVERISPDRLLQQGDLVETPIGPLEVRHYSGHTVGQIGLYHAQRNALFSGDALINVIPFRWETGLTPPVKVFSADHLVGWQSVLEIERLAPEVLYPGHGPALLESAGKRIAELVAARQAGLKYAPKAHDPARTR